MPETTVILGPDANCSISAVVEAPTGPGSLGTALACTEWRQAAVGNAGAAIMFAVLVPYLFCMLVQYGQPDTRTITSLADTSSGFRPDHAIR